MTSSSAAIVLDGVSKAYPAWAGRGRTVRDVVTRRMPLSHRRSEQRWALHGVSLEIAPGESVGLIGGNGAGKSTLLRVASGLARPTNGRVAVVPGASAVLTLGEAFALELTGEENALTTAIVSGFSPSEARQRLPEILAYAELEDAAHAPVRTYSEGMKLRLAFAVVAQLRPPALLLDEVMAVGDVGFQRKSQAWIAEARRRGTAVLVASHDLGRIVSDCDRVVWLEQGRVRRIGEPSEVVGAYEAQMIDETNRRTPALLASGDGRRVGSQELTIDDIAVRGNDGRRGSHATIGAGDALAIEWTVSGVVEDGSSPVIAIVIRDQHGTQCCSVTTDRDAIALPRALERHAMRLDFERLDLAGGEYDIEIGLYRGDWGYAYDLHSWGHTFSVVGSGGARGVMDPPRRWAVEPARLPVEESA